jgi:thiosulfate reductase cytochrome b subunit
MGKEIKKEMVTNNSIYVHLEYLKEAADKQDTKLDDLAKAIKNDYVTKSEYEPIKKIVYGVVLLLFAGAITLITGALL